MQFRNTKVMAFGMPFHLVWAFQVIIFPYPSRLLSSHSSNSHVPGARDCKACQGPHKEMVSTGRSGIQTPNPKIQSSTLYQYWNVLRHIIKACFYKHKMAALSPLLMEFFWALLINNYRNDYREQNPLWALKYTLSSTAIMNFRPATWS